MYLLFTDSFEDLMKIRVFSLFSYETIITTPQTENIIGSKGFRWIDNGFMDEILTFFIIVSGIIHSFCKEKVGTGPRRRLRAVCLPCAMGSPKGRWGWG